MANLVAGLLGAVGGTAGSVAKREEKKEESARDANLLRLRQKYQTSERVAGEEVRAGEAKKGRTFTREQAVTKAEALKEAAGKTRAHDIEKTKITTGAAASRQSATDIKDYKKQRRKLNTDLAAALDAGDTETANAVQQNIDEIDQILRSKTPTPAKGTGKYSALWGADQGTPYPARTQ